MALVPRSKRAVADQIIGHDLVGTRTDQLLAIAIIELRRLREDMALYFNRQPETPKEE